MVVESLSVKGNAKNARGLGRDTAPFPKSCASYFRFARFNTFPLYYLRAWHRLEFLWLSLRTPVPLIVFPAHFFFSMLFARSTQAKRHRSGRIFYLCNPFRGNVQILHRLQYCLQLKNFTVPRVACKEKADPCKFLAVQKFLKAV